MNAPECSSGRFADVWPGEPDCDPSAVVAELRSRAPAWLRSQIRPMTVAERRLWRHLGDRAWMGADVFSQVPVYLPEVNRGFVLAFLIPACRVGIEVVHERRVPSLSMFARAMEQDDLVREIAKIATMRCIESTVLRDPKAVAESIRWNLGLEKGDGNFFTIKVPRV